MKSVAVVLASVVAAVSAQSVTTLAFACPPQDLYPSVYCPNGSGTNGQTLSCYYGNGMDSSSCALTSKWWCEYSATTGALTNGDNDRNWNGTAYDPTSCPPQADSVSARRTRRTRGAHAEQVKRAAEQHLKGAKRH